MLRELDHLSCEDRLRELGLFSLGGENSPWRRYSGLPVPKWGLQESWVGTFIQEYSDIPRGNGFKLKEGRFGLDMLKEFFSMRMVRYWEKAAQRSCRYPIPEGVQEPRWMAL